ncbi:MAG: electron transport complex subunit RsxC [Chloroflexota bacterium]
MKREVNIRLKTKSTHGGVKLPESKLLAESPIEPAPLPETVFIPLQQNIGAPPKALVKRGEKVLKGQKIADTDRFVSAPVHASASGEVTRVTTAVNPATGQVMDALVITSDGEDKWVELDVPEDPEALSTEEILKRIREAGIVGMGGACFPTHVKLSPPKDNKIDTVILNGCECEPSITADHRLMLEYGEQILKGLNIIKKVLSAKDTYIAIEDNKEDAMNHLEGLIAKTGYDFTIAPIRTKFPGGAEKTLIKSILGREVPIGGLPLAVGVVVQNVATAKAIYDAIYEGKPVIERVVTVTGAVKNPRNLMVRIGTPIKDMIDYCGGKTEEAGEIIIGGPMMGIAQYDLNFPVVKGTNCILIKTASPIQEKDCINCGRCITSCVMGLMPTFYPKYVKKGLYDECEAAYVTNCFECGVCAYNCPSNIPIVQYIKVAKKELVRRKANK